MTGNGLYHIKIVIWLLVYDIVFTHINGDYINMIN